MRRGARLDRSPTSGRGRSPGWRRASTKAKRKLPKKREFRFFGGKGGVGKTTLAAARAVRLAESTGSRVLVLSTDPAHSLGDALAVKLGPSLAQIEAVKRGELEAMELDAAGALERWLSPKKSALRIVAERGTYFDRDDLDAMLDLSLPGIDELIGLVEIVRAARASAAHEVVVDTAPTGHTLRLFAMPDTLSRIAEVFDDMQAKHRYMKESIAGRYRSDATDAVIEAIAEEGAALAALVKDPARCRFTWVLLPEVLSVDETIDGIRALEALGVAVDEVIINHLTPPPPSRCAYCDGRRRNEARALKPLASLLEGRDVVRIQTSEREPRGIAALRAMERAR